MGARFEPVCAATESNPQQRMTGRSRRRSKPLGATTRGGRGAAHHTARAAIAPIVNAGKATCARCNEPIHQGEDWHLDHNDTRDGYLGYSRRRLDICSFRILGLRA